MVLQLPIACPGPPLYDTYVHKVITRLKCFTSCLHAHNAQENQRRILQRQDYFSKSAGEASGLHPAPARLPAPPISRDLIYLHRLPRALDNLPRELEPRAIARRVVGHVEVLSIGLWCHGTRYVRHARDWYSYSVRTVCGA